MWPLLQNPAVFTECVDMMVEYIQKHSPQVKGICLKILSCAREAGLH